jgi:hypothetical protein
MATTTNYSWTTPDDTALVKDGAAAIRSLGTAIDSTVFTNAGAAVTKATVDAKGDLIAGTADNTVARLAVGANDTVLTADSSTATGLKWAAPAGGGANWSLLNAGGTALTGAATITVSGISGKDKVLVLFEASSVNASAYVSVRVNTDSGANYNIFGTDLTAASVYVSSFLDGEQAVGDNGIAIGRMSNTDTSLVTGAISFNGCNASGVKHFIVTGGAQRAGGTGHMAYYTQGVYTGSSTISSISVVSSTGNFDAGTVYVYTSA